jgi:hypothetical protein
MVQQRHLILYSMTAAEQQVFSEFGASGAIPAVAGDALAVVTQNSSGNKIDWYLRRSVSYRAAYDPSTGVVHSTAEVALRNDAPPSGEPAFVIGGFGRLPTALGENRTYLSVYSALQLDGVTVDGVPVAFSAQEELGRNVYSAFLVLPPRSTTTVILRLDGAIEGGARYDLTVRGQPTVVPDQLDVQIDGADGWSPQPAPSVTIAGRSARFSGVETHDIEVTTDLLKP